MKSNHKINLGLCCLLENNKNYKFKTYTRKKLEEMSDSDAKESVHKVIIHNIDILQKFFDFCSANSINSYRLSSDLIPHYQYITTRGLVSPEEMKEILKKFSNLKKGNTKLSFHPGQHVNMGSHSSNVIENSHKDLQLHMLLSNAIGFDEINIHLGGAYGEKDKAISRFIDNTKKYKNVLTIENDELTYSIDDCIDVANKIKIPVTFDLHHHRSHCLKEDYTPALSEHEYFILCKQTWINSGREYMRMHISSPRNGYTTASKSRPHSDYINFSDIPDWLIEESKNFEIHIDVEAKAKENAIFQLNDFLNNKIV